jgi:hypothetical protein
MVAPAIHTIAYQRIPYSGYFRQPVIDYRGGVCNVHKVNQAGDYYFLCPYTAYPLFPWSPLIALVGLLIGWIGVRGSSPMSVPFLGRFTWGLEILAGIEGIYISWVSLLGQAVFESYIGLLGYPLGFLFVLDGLRRPKAGRAVIALTAIAILVLSGILFFLVSIAAMMMSD